MIDNMMEQYLEYLKHKRPSDIPRRIQGDTIEEMAQHMSTTISCSLHLPNPDSDYTLIHYITGKHLNSCTSTAVGILFFLTGEELSLAELKAMRFSRVLDQLPSTPEELPVEPLVLFTISSGDHRFSILRVHGESCIIQSNQISYYDPVSIAPWETTDFQPSNSSLSAFACASLRDASSHLGTAYNDSNYDPLPTTHPIDNDSTYTFEQYLHFPSIYPATPTEHGDVTRKFIQFRSDSELCLFFRELKRARQTHDCSDIYRKFIGIPFRHGHDDWFVTSVLQFHLEPSI